MWFKQLSVFQLPSDYALSAAELDAALTAHPLQPCGAFDMQRSGWVAPNTAAVIATSANACVYSVDGQQLIALGVEQKLLPASIIRQQASERAQLLEAEQGHAPTRRQLRDLKQTVADELCARALSRRQRTLAWIDEAARRLVIASATAAQCEQLLSALRDALGSFNAPPLATRQNPGAAMRQWLEAGAAPAGFTIDQDLELRASADTKHCVRYSYHPLDDREVRVHLKSGLVPTRLGLTWRDRVALQLDDKLQLRRLQFVGLIGDAADAGDTSPEERFDTDFVLMTRELSKLLDALTTALGGPAE